MMELLNFKDEIMSIEHKKLLYHITDIENLPDILKTGLLPRSKLANFVDVADSDILASRTKLELENMVPFHFFARNPFDGRVQVDNPQKDFILITMQRSFAERNGWKIIPKHPLASDDIELMDYQLGFSAINWDKMNERDYADAESKSVGMAECLSPTAIQASNFFKIFVKSENIKNKVADLLSEFKLSTYLDITQGMFLK
jgi:uncharacterized ubiquitin-like protein YukD